jgi:hypothetical protein
MSGKVNFIVASTFEHIFGQRRKGVDFGVVCWLNE